MKLEKNVKVYWTDPEEAAEFVNAWWNVCEAALIERFGPEAAVDAHGKSIYHQALVYLTNHGGK